MDAVWKASVDGALKEEKFGLLHKKPKLIKNL